MNHDVKQALYNHSDEASAYVIQDYPYSFKLRTEMRVWLEHKPSKGWRLVRRTLNPKTGVWNAPKTSTYMALAACMYMDQKDHVEWTGLSGYSDAVQVLQFVQTFPQADMSELKPFAQLKVPFLTKYSRGEVYMTINDVKQELTDHQVEEYGKELEVWKQINELLKGN